MTILEAGPPIDRDAAVEVFRAATAKVPESPYPNTAWAPRPSVLEIGIPGTGLLRAGGAGHSAPPTSGSSGARRGIGWGRARACCHPTSR